jgi:hypothetical protein
MAGLVPAIHAFSAELKARKKDVDARDKRGHDARNTSRGHASQRLRRL